jgi:HEAT repeat protein
MIEQFAMADLARTVERLAAEQVGGEDWRDRDEKVLAAQVKSQWRRLEQSAIVLGAIDYKPAADRLVALLQYPRVEVRVATAIALRRLAIRDTLPDAFAYAKRAADWQIRKSTDPHVGLGVAHKGELDEQMAHLMQMFALMDYFPPQVVALMQKHVPKTTPATERFGKEARAAAIWALGHFRAGRPDKALANELASRINDNSPMDPEEAVVKRMAAITLGRMGVKFSFALGMVERYMRISASTVDLGGACRWAYMQITGKYVEPYGPLYRKQVGLSFRILDDHTPEDEYDTEIE